MARKIARLTALDVKRAKRRGMYHDGGGLYLSIAANGSKSWTFRYGAQGRHHLGLGPLHTIDLAEARERARQARVLLLDGKDPIAERRAQRAAQRLAEAKSITFSRGRRDLHQLAPCCLEESEEPAPVGSDARDLCLPGDREAASRRCRHRARVAVRRTDLGEKTETASRVRRRIERVLAWATTHGYRSGPNPAAWSGHLDNLLPAASKLAPVTHHPAMPFADIPAFIQELHARHGIAPLAMEFVILTAARTSEVLGAEWGEFDLDDARVDGPGAPHEIGP